MPQLGLYHKTEEYSDKGYSLQKTTVTFDRKKVELKCIIKEKDDGIALNKGPTISFVRKGPQKKQSPRVLQFSSKAPLPNME